MDKASMFFRLFSMISLICGVFCQGRTFIINYDNNTFMMDGQPFRYISGSIHYQRVPNGYWDDRLKKMAAAGLNAIQTYVPWNAHEKLQSQFEFTGDLDIVRFLQTAHKYNLSVILRPGPYICAEWEFGGLPAWLLKYPNMKVRTMDPRYIQAVDVWFTKLFGLIKPLLHQNGGPIITVQIENEYGSYPACDYDYLRFLQKKTKSMLGEEVVLFTTDGAGDNYLKCGTLPDVYATVDFGVTDTPEKSFVPQRHKEPKGPLVNSEFYAGWLDHWGQKHSTVNTAALAKSLDLILALGANVNMYMFEGGTNFGFWNGANMPFQPVPTSYDYDAPLTEAGDITDKYMALRQVISKYNSLPTMKVPPSTPKKAYGKVQLSFAMTIMEYVFYDEPIMSKYPENMETLDHYYGFVLYQHILKSSFDYAYLNMSGVRDRAYLSVGDQRKPIPYGYVQRGVNPVYKISGTKGDYVHILVENMGRINYGGHLNENHKGIISNVTLNGTILTDWILFPIKASEEMMRQTRNQQQSTPPSTTGIVAPSIYIGELTIDQEPMDTYMDMSQWVKGQVFVNGHNLGRYWPKEGPQLQTISDYVAVQPPVTSEYPLTMETLDHYYGFVLYRHRLTKNIKGGVLSLTGVRDRGYLMLGNKSDPHPYGIVFRRMDMVVKLTAQKGDILHILVENMGRVGLGETMDDNKKGIISNVTLDGAILKHWEHFPITMSDGRLWKPASTVAPTQYTGPQQVPSVYGGTFMILEDPQDTYLDMSKWTKGQVFINGVNIGKYWPSMGPQVRLFVPKQFLDFSKSNKVIVVELEGTQCNTSSYCDVEFVDQPLINATVPLEPSSASTMMPNAGVLIMFSMDVLISVFSCIIF